MVDRLYKVRLHRKTHRALESMVPLNLGLGFVPVATRGRLDYIFRDAAEHVFSNCLRTFDKEALRWCKGTHMLEPFCSTDCLKESWDAGACADFSDVVEEDDDKRSISLKRNILQWLAVKA